MHMIAYTSEYHGDLDNIPQVLTFIEATAKYQNPQYGISGVLFFENNNFLQIIEGPETSLRQLMKNIEADNNNKNITVLLDEAIEMGSFKDWNMDVFHLKSGVKFNARTLDRLTEQYKKILKPDSKMLMVFYKSLLEEQTRGLKSRRAKRSKLV